MKLQTIIPLRAEQNQMDYNSQLLLLGSCFSEHMGYKLEYFKFQLLQNPFGIFFHPLAIEKLISKAIKKDTYTEEDVFYLNERWHCFDAHSDLSNTSKENLIENLNVAIRNTHQQIKKVTHVVITLGTAWAYRYTETDSIVANCHKVPQAAFKKELLSVDQIVKSLEHIIQSIQTINKNAQFIFTVSPVRHLKDGFVENQRSKAHLISAIHKLIEVPSLGSRKLFPSYEIMMDELRDYRFYESDMIHPNKLAIDYIWERFKKVWIDETAYSTIDKVEEVQRGLRHRPFNSSSEQHQLFLKSLNKKISYLKEEYPFMQFS